MREDERGRQREREGERGREREREGERAQYVNTRNQTLSQRCLNGPLHLKQTIHTVGH